MNVLSFVINGAVGMNIKEYLEDISLKKECSTGCNSRCRNDSSYGIIISSICYYR